MSLCVRKQKTEGGGGKRNPEPREKGHLRKKLVQAKRICVSLRMTPTLEGPSEDMRLSSI